MKPLVSIVIPVYNGEDYLEEAIESALHQTYENIEILVVNDGSTDRTEQIAKAYGDKIRYFHKPNGGVATALNLGIREMKGAYFSWLSHDDYDYPEKIEAMVDAALRQGDREAIVYCNYSLLDQRTGILSPYRIEEYYSERDRANGVLMVIQRLMDGCSMLIPISHFRRVGLFDEKLPATQDNDMWFRMLRGRKVIHIPQVLHVARVHEKQGSQTMKGFALEREQLFLRFLQELSSEEMREIWGSEYCCLQTFCSVFESDTMRTGREYVQERLRLCEAPSNALQLQRRAREEIYGLGGKAVKKLAIFGAGEYGRRVLQLLRSRGMEADVFWDNAPQKWGTEIEGIKCISVDEGLQAGAHTLVILAAELFGGMQRQLEGKELAGVITRMHLEGKLYNVPCRRETQNERPDQ